VSSHDADLKWRHTWQHFRSRKWEDVRDSWVEHIPTFTAIAARPDPGLEHLLPLLEIPLDRPTGLYPDVAGLRTNTLWEAVFLFHKCSHTNLAAQRLAVQGMHSWCLFNAYHSAYLGAKGIMALLGVAFPNLKSNQVALDLFPEPEKKARNKGSLKALRFEEFLIVRLPKIDQRRIWEGFQRLLKMCYTQCWDATLCVEILNLKYETITPPRNHFLYKAHYWPLEDLALDVVSSELETLLTSELDADNNGFLLRLSFLVYRLFEQLMNDLGEFSPVIKTQVEASRCVINSEMPELRLYRGFMSGFDSVGLT
jgi:hypothetical protein